ncbi:helix-turn-helix transcriptional regulator [Brevibacillus sp. SYP-B805]|uniref:helix-turn-helix domain-containing protein n=1 Tax=Brevibacillus sp. SYP-B805 TaxID=1578199 RepID=UPI0013ED6E69|nr:helix-turn-helix transcriptional regulator [Brevibacillus sp. SYP-B805]
MTVGERLKKLRHERGLSQQALSDQLGINRSTYARYETNDNQADYETLLALATFFGTSVDYLLGRTEHAGMAEASPSPSSREQQDAAAGPPAYKPRDLHQLIKEESALQFDGDLLHLNEKEREDLLLHLRVAWMMIKEKRRTQQ